MGDGQTAFFYGTLMAPPVLFRVIYGSSTPEPWQRALTTVRPGLLHSFRRHRVAHADYPAILPHINSTVRGSIVTGLTEGDLYRLDIFEGSQYVRKTVRVQVLKDVKLDEAADEASQTQGVEEVEAMTYVWRDSPNELEPQEWDFEGFKRDKMRAWMGESGHENGNGDTDIDEGFGDVDRAVAEQERLKHDPTGGRGANGKITQQLKNAAV